LTQLSTLEIVQQWEKQGNSSSIFVASTTTRMKHHNDRNVEAAAAAAASTTPPPKSPIWRKVLLSQLGLAGISAAAAAALLYLVNPPITQFKRVDPATSEKQDWRKVLLVCFIVLILVFIMPEVLTLAHIFTK
jgi:fatty acid desaturase